MLEQIAIEVQTTKIKDFDFDRNFLIGKRNSKPILPNIAIKTIARIYITIILNTTLSLAKEFNFKPSCQFRS